MNCMKYSIALAGNPNSGKTTLFNLLTGSNQYVGNWAGVTVEKKQGVLKSDNSILVTDLPGIYSLSPYTPEEVVAENFILEEKPNLILNIVDGTNIQRNLYLSLQLIETGVPIVCAVNMVDIMKKRGDKLSVKSLEKLLGVPVVEISALKNTGIDELIEKVKNSIKENKSVPIHKFNSKIENTLMKIQNIEKVDRCTSIKIFQGDKKGSSTTNFLIKECENYFNDIGESIIISQRYDYIERLLSVCYKKSNKKSITYYLDIVLTGKYTAIPMFFLIVFLMFYTSVSLFGATASDFVNDVIFGGLISPTAKSLLTIINCNSLLTALICNGIITGVGSVLAFVPQLAVLFFLLSFLEDSGYMARVAFLMDKIFSKFGLSGKSVIPLVIGTGCTVPGVMASRTIEEKSSRNLTILTTGFIPCSAKLPVIALIGTTFFKGSFWLVPMMYAVGIIAVLLSSLIFKKPNEKTIPFIMELPNYHMPKLTVLLTHSWNRLKAFLLKAGTVLILVCTVLWILSNTGINGNSFLSLFSRIIAPIFAPLGFGSWQATSAVFAGLFAKENIVATLNLLSTDLHALFPTKISAIVFLLFNLLNSPCVMALTTMARELGDKRIFLKGVAYQNIFAYSVCLVIYQLFGLMTGAVYFNIFTILAIAIILFFLYRIKRGLFHNSPHTFINP